MKNATGQQKIINFRKIVDHDPYHSFRGSSITTRVIGAASGLQQVMEQVQQVAPLETPVLLLGETGVGKEVIADVIHQQSPRYAGPLIKVNCGAIPDTLLDSEFFGHEKGSFTGASTRTRGYFERAHTGTIFLDEVGELSLAAQVRLLRVLEEQTFERVGGSHLISVDIRVIAATHRNLSQMVKDGLFREDLWFRLNVFPLEIPPLRQRKEDLPALAEHFLRQQAREHGLECPVSLAPGAMERLYDYDWPGNVRELRNVIERALIRYGTGPLRFECLTQDLQQPRPCQSLEKRERPLPTLNEFNACYIRHVLSLTHGKINGPGGAAEVLDIHPNTLRKRMQKLGIDHRTRTRRQKSQTCL